MSRRTLGTIVHDSGDLIPTHSRSLGSIVEAFSGLVPIGSASPSGAGTIDILSIITSTYRVYKIILNLTFSNDGVRLNLRTASDNATPDTGASDYAYMFGEVEIDATPTVSYSGDDANNIVFMTSDTLGNATTEGLELTFWLIDPLSTAKFTRFFWEGVFGDDIATSLTNKVSGAGVRLEAAVVNALRFYPSAGTVTGEVSIYGLRDF